MNTYDVKIELHDRRQSPPIVMWSGIRRVQANNQALAYAQASLQVRRDEPVPKTFDYYTQPISATIVPAEEVQP
jgi:hypothetical protein